MKKNILVILGMHRSGTSLTTNWLQQCGLNIGNQLEGKKISNPDGHFEDLDFLNLHEEILTSKEVPYHGTENPNDFIISNEQEQKIIQLVENKNIAKEWGWKDPRTCLFLNVYRRIIPEANYLTILRPYTEIIDSLLRRKYTPIEKKIEKRKLGKLKLQKYKLSVQKKGLPHSIDYYENAVINYYTSLTQHLETIDKNKSICFKLEDIHHLDEQIISELNDKMGFNLNYVPISTIFQQKYLKNKPKFYTEKTQNSAKLQQLQLKIESFCTNE